MGIQINGQTDTVTAIDGSITVGTDLTVPGVLTYDDVTNIDSIGVVTARSGIDIGTGVSITSPSSNVLTLGTNSVERFRIDSAGLVGIGTVSPSGPIHAHTASGTQRSYLEASAAHSFLRLKSGSTSYNSGLEFFSGASNIANINGLGAGGLQFEVNGSERLRITGIGSVGIGTDDPTSAKLHVRQDSGELARFQVNTQTSSGRIVCVGGTASYSGINFGDSDNVDAGRIRHYNDDNSDANNSFLFYTNDTERIALNKYGLLNNYPGSGSAETGGTILGRYKYTQSNQSQNYEHLILAPDGRKLQDLVDTNCFCIITVCVTGTGTDNMFCQYHYHANSSSGTSALTHIRGNSSASSNRPYMVLVNTHDPAWKMNHNTSYVQDIEVAIYGGNNQYTYTTQFGQFGANP